MHVLCTDNVLCRSPDLIIEVAHPCVTTEHGAYFLQHADYMVRTYVCVYVHTVWVVIFEGLKFRVISKRL